MLEFNADLAPRGRSSDSRLENDIMDIFKDFRWSYKKRGFKVGAKTCITVFLASAGYPESYERTSNIWTR